MLKQTFMILYRILGMKKGTHPYERVVIAEGRDKALEIFCNSSELFLPKITAILIVDIRGQAESGPFLFFKEVMFVS